MTTKNDRAWEDIFNKYDILNKINDDGQFIITAGEIKKFREPRLMTKFDNRGQLPEIFKIHKLTILPITRGSYSISHYKVYHTFEEVEEPIIEVEFPKYIHSIDWDDITSEATAINVAYISNMLADFLEDDGLLPTVDGRMSSGVFEYLIYNHTAKKDFSFEVRNSQIEIDGGFEGYNSLSLIEAKNILSEDFLVRQLYYPYRLWNNQLNKKVRPIFMTYSNNVFTLYEYKFTNEEHYNSLKLIKSARYTLRQEPIILDDILNIYRNIDFVEEDQSIPFIQADKFERIINICELLYERGWMSPVEIANEYGFVIRQSDYYYNAGRYIGLFRKQRTANGTMIALSKFGLEIMRMRLKDRNLTLVKKILEHSVIHKCFGFVLENQEYPTKDEYASIMKHYPINIGNNRIEMYKRRSSSITGWIKWIMSLIR